MYLRARHFGTTALAVILLSGCSSVLMDPSVYKIFQEESVNVTVEPTGKLAHCAVLVL